MRLHRFFVEEKLKANKKVKISDDILVNQWRNVLRYQVGQEMILLDNSGFEFRALLVSLTHRAAEVEIISSRPAVFTPPQPVFIFLAMAKRNAFEWAIEKGTEIGVTGFIPVVTDHSEKKSLNLDRSRSIIKESCEQSNRGTLPEVYEPITFSESVRNANGLSFVLDPRGVPFNPSVYKSGERVNVFIGPEGGWSKAEIDVFKEKNIPIYSLGKQVLRVETAVASISSLLLLG